MRCDIAHPLAHSDTVQILVIKCVTHTFNCGADLQIELLLNVRRRKRRKGL